VNTLAKDAELDRLKTAQDLMYQRKQDAHRAQQAAWEHLSSTREVMNRAFEAKQRAYDVQDSSWQSLQRLRDSYGPRIEQLNRDQERAFQDMGRAFQNASDAHNNRNGAMAASYAADGHRYKAESQGYVAERRRLISELRDAKERHENTKPAFQRAKDEFNSAKRAFEQARTAHDTAKQKFQEAKAAFDKASTDFRTRLEKVKADNASRNNDRREIARRAGVPTQYLNSVWVSPNGKGGHNIYFGGVGSPNGPGHAHYATDSFGKVTYKRDPFDPHGAHNFTENQGDYYDMVSRESTSGDFGFRCRFRGYDAYVETNTNRDGTRKIDIYYGPNGPFGPGHHHAGALRSAPHTLIFDELR
tara:strand:+ start:8417 stop:9493 length:1077 start_codon:yes stop_codon:yes gene_type:complete